MDVIWIKIDSWHIKKASWEWASSYIAETYCGLQRMWDGTGLDRLPGGDEKSCENCLKIFARGSDEEPAEEKPRRRGKSK